MRTLEQITSKFDYNKIEPIRKTIEPEKHAARYKMHRFFTRRPFNVIQRHINHYSKPGDVVLDPYVGTGITAVEALIARRKTIAVDNAPLSTFITKMIALSPVNIREYENTYEKINDACEDEINKIYKSKDSKLKKITLPFLKKYELPENADVRTVQDLFTPKQLLSLYKIYNEIKKIKNKIMRSLMTFTFSATLTFTNIMYDRGSSSPFAVYRYWVPKKLQEVNVWDYFERRYKAVLKGKKETNDLIGNFYKEGDTFKIFTNSATHLTKFIKESSIDYIFTDPPYGANIAYIDLSAMWNAWLGFKVTEKDRELEVIEGGQLKKTQQNYIDLLRKSFEEMYDVLKKDRWMSVVFHHKELKLWNAVVNGAKDAGFEYINVVSQPSARMLTFRKIQSPLRALAGELIINFQKTKKKAGIRISVGSDIRSVILNTAERLIVQNNGATTDEIYHVVVPELLDANLIDKAVEEINDITPLLKKEFDLEKNKWQIKKGKKLGEWIPRRDKIKFYLTSLLRREKEASLETIIQKLMPLMINGTHPGDKEIMHVLEQIAEPTDGKWKLKNLVIRTKQKTLGKGLPAIKFNLINERKNHTEMIYALASLAKIIGFKVWIGKKEQSQKYFNINLIDLCDYEELPILEIKRVARKIIEQIDIIWFKDNEPVAAFEVENTTNVQRGIMRFVNLIKKDPKIASKLYILAPNSRKSKVEKELKNPAFIGYPLFIEKKVSYILYSDFISLYNNARKTLRTNLPEINRISRIIIIKD